MLTEDELNRGERARAAIESGAAKLSDMALDLCLRFFAVLKYLYYRVRLKYLYCRVRLKDI